MDNYRAERFKENCAGPCEVVIVPNCDHFYVGAEEQVEKTVTQWLSRTLVINLAKDSPHPYEMAGHSRINLP